MLLKRIFRGPIGIIIMMIFHNHLSYAQNNNNFQILKGIVLDENNLPIQLATIKLQETSLYTQTDEKGRFQFRFSGDLQQITLHTTFVGKSPTTLTIKKDQFDRLATILLIENSLTLEEVAVSGSHAQSNNSISSITFNEEAIERVQAFSLMDVLHTLPGKQMTPPNINAPQTLTLRGGLGGAHDLNNSLGIPIIMDGVILSNDGNMQSRPVAQRGMGNAALQAVTSGNTADVPFRGIDLREIPVESIEKIEVIQGVASAEYSELTDGVIIIERKAGRSPWQITTNINHASSNYSLNKGFNLPGRWGGITTDLNYALSNSDPRDKVQQYNRYGASIRWNTLQYRVIRNRLSLDYNWKIDEAKLDPDDHSFRQYYSRQTGLRISNNTLFKINRPWLDDINLTLSYSETRQASYAQWLLNQSMKGYTAKDTTGIYEGLILSGQYMAVEEIIGKPVSASANLKFSSQFDIGRTQHQLAYGFNGNYTNNGGKGIISDPERPRFVNYNDQNIRPYSFELNPALINMGFYFTDNFRYTLFGKKSSSNLGFRVDSQNGSISFQPRLSTSTTLNHRWNIAAAFGVSSKSPTLAHRYPVPSWIDIPLILAYNSQASLYLVYTEKFQTANPDLKPTKSTQAEITIHYRHPAFSSRINAFYKGSRDGFQSTRQFQQIRLPNYDYHFDTEARQMVYAPNGTFTDYNDKSYYSIGNLMGSNTYGFDWMLSTNQVAAINTRFSTSTSLIISSENKEYLDIVDLAAPVEWQNENVWYVLYEPASNDRQMIVTSKLNTTTHIPKLGFVVMTNTDIFWMNKRFSKYKDGFQPAVGYLNTAMEQIMLNQGENNLFPSRNQTLARTNQRMVYANFSLSVAKEIGKKMRIAITAYNAFNLQPESIYFDPDTGREVITRYNSPLSITGGISIKI